MANGHHAQQRRSLGPCVSIAISDTASVGRPAGRLCSSDLVFILIYMYDLHSASICHAQVPCTQQAQTRVFQSVFAAVAVDSEWSRREPKEDAARVRRRIARGNLSAYILYILVQATGCRSQRAPTGYHG